MDSDMKTMQGIRSLMPSLSALMAALVLAGCASAPPTVAEHAGVAVPASFSVQAAAAGWTQAAPAEAQPRGAWWRVFADTELSALVERAGEANTDVQTAAARLAEARALLRSADAQRQPQIGAAGGAARQAGVNTANGMQPATLVTAGLNFSYEADLFGRLSRASEAAREDANAREALLQSTRLMVQADVAQTYLQLRSLQTERQLVEQSLAAYRETLTLIEKRYRAGDAAELDVARMQTEVSATEAETLALERQQAALTHALAVLVGDVASGFALASQPQAATLPMIPAGVPATVLARRPDVSAAQASVLAAQARVGVAQAAWFPAITLTGNGGYASPELGDLFKWSARSWGIGALLSLPIFDGGQRAAQEEGARARLEAAVAAQRGQVLAAFRDVEDQLSALRLLSGQARVLGQAVQSSERATHLSDVRYRNGLVSQLELLDARRNELRNRRQALQVRTAQYTATVALIRALGGGWDSGEPVAASS
ncbi:MULTISPECIES: efflux transporter outer membrane subunit [unclassified Comamonas]|uniref:efflux transporter outer membrane subunit n=1 Tax=unclassified Comamonas TaxID=2638500 RepID=UPI001FA70FCA|nr:MULTISPECIES: efflux transporter outer membrane subunit [unclassified Comamonas]UNV93255.1 efflux transporter outer membrane subunit [Comamonas sp. 7D-2evo1]UNV98063.1 efflux transporter outer membrane subunit [Comamonas sp. 7D-2]UNW02889.1 efflux transporter outer membrane subunit [Comamonas sp. 7D-2evo2]